VLAVAREGKQRSRAQPEMKEKRCERWRGKMVVAAVEIFHCGRWAPL
jgi:hypothetical protein